MARLVRASLFLAAVALAAPAAAALPGFGSPLAAADLAQVVGTGSSTGVAMEVGTTLRDGRRQQVTIAIDPWFVGASTSIRELVDVWLIEVGQPAVLLSLLDG